MHSLLLTSVFLAASSLVAADALAACTGSNGRGWGRGNGAGAFEMTQADKTCLIRFPSVINDKAGTRDPATKYSVTRAPANGTLKASADGVIYTPKKGFAGKDVFCTTNRTDKAPGTVLSGCVTVTVAK